MGGQPLTRKWKQAIWAIVALCLASTAWRYRGSIAHLVEARIPSKPIVFDNGSARQPDAPPSPSAQDTQHLPNGVARKCLRAGESTYYTDQACPPGSREKAVDTGRVTVLTGADAGRPAPAQPPAHARKTLHDALDLSDDKHLRERIIERAGSGAAQK